MLTHHGHVFYQLISSPHTFVVAVSRQQSSYYDYYTATNLATTVKRRPLVGKSKVGIRAQTTPKKFLFQLRASDNEYGVSEERLPALWKSWLLIRPS